MTIARVDVTEATSVDRDGWDRFVAAQPAAEAGHRWGLLDALREVFGQRSVRLIAKRGGAVVGVLPIVVQKSLLGRFATSVDRKSTRLNSSHSRASRMPSSA